MALLRGYDHNLDIVSRSGELGFDGGAGRSAAGGEPCIPNRVHFLECRHVRQPNVYAQQLGFVRSRLSQKTIDDSEDFLGLLGNTLSSRFIGDLAGEINRVAVNDGSAHALAGADTLNGHGSLVDDVQ